MIAPGRPGKAITLSSEQEEKRQETQYSKMEIKKGAEGMRGKGTRA